MKRLNPATNQPFKRGDVREDGRVFKGYIISRVKQNGFFVEEWLLREKFDRLKQLAAQHYINNIDYHKQRGKINKLKNRHHYTALQAQRRAAKLQRTPIWLTIEHRQEIRAMYTIAKQLEKQYGEKFRRKTEDYQGICRNNG